MERIGRPYPESYPSGYRARNVHDGAIAAAIGATLAIALETDHPVRTTLPYLVETPWVYSSRSWMTGSRSGWQKQDKWGVLSGWGSGPGRWRPKN